MTFRQNVIFWILILVVLTLLFGQGPGGLIQSFYFVCMLMPVAVGTSWLFNDILVPRYLIPGRYVKFVVNFIYSMIISLWAQMVVIFLSFILLANYQLENMDPLTTNIRLLTLTIYGIVFLQAFVNMYRKFQEASHAAAKLATEQKKQEKGYLMVRANRKQRRLAYEDILYVESLSDYLRFVLKEAEPVTTRETISRLEKQLPQNFVRIHRSFIVRKESVQSFTREEVHIGDQVLPVGRKYKEEFVRRMG